MRNLLLLALLSVSFLACGGEGTGMPTVPSTDMPEAGAPATPAMPDADAGPANK
jgi:hypothetical protein